MSSAAAYSQLGLLQLGSAVTYALHYSDPVDAMSAGSFLHIEDMRHQIMPIFVTKDQDMSKTHTEQETVDNVMTALKNPTRLFKSNFVNWGGKTSDTGIPHVEVVSRILLDNIEILESIPCIKRSLPYRTLSHDGVYDPSSNRKEEIVGMILLTRRQFLPTMEKSWTIRHLSRQMDSSTEKRRIENFERVQH